MDLIGDFGIANFEEENSVAVVARSWVKEGEKICSYPPAGTRNIKKLVKKNQIPNPTWPEHEIRLLKWFGK